MVLALVLAAAFAALAPAGAVQPDAAPASQPPTLVGAGDIAGCDKTGDEATAALLDRIPGTIFTLGDNVYVTGSLAEFQACYEPSWGRHKARTRPTAGNHDYATPGAAGYFAYFGAAAGPVNKGYYSYTLGAWKVIVLNTNCYDATTTITPDPDYLDGNSCAPGSPQFQWLEAELASSPRCTLAYFHHPLFTSGTKRGRYPWVKAYWDVLYRHGVEFVMNGDDHVYERFAKQTPEGLADPVRGIRQFTVGTGGYEAYPWGNLPPLPNSEVRGTFGTFGVLKLELKNNSYKWQFVPIAGQSFTDAGQTDCHA